MSAHRARCATAHGREEPDGTCRAPNCWRDGSPVLVAGETTVPTVLCDEHTRMFLGVSS